MRKFLLNEPAFIINDENSTYTHRAHALAASSANNIVDLTIDDSADDIPIDILQSILELKPDFIRRMTQAILH